MDLADDVHRFVLKNGTIIQMAPLQAYLSALLFTPGETLTRRLFAKQVPRWILREPIVDKKWGSVIHSLENKHELKSLAFSHDSKILALQLYRVVQLWDVSTGLLRAELSTGLSAVSSQLCAMKFSHDSRLLASVPFPGDVFIWEVHTGIQKHRIPCPAKVDTLTFSPDSNLLALCYSSSSEIWDTNTWTLTKKVSCMPHFEWSRGSACFSPNLNVFVPPPRNGKIELRDTDTCSLRQTFGTGDELSKIAFSPEGKLLASGSEDGTIRIWNVMSSSLERTIRDHTRRIVFINFSHDSQTFVSVSFDGLIYVRNTITWSVIPTIDGQYSRRINPGVMSVSNDCKLLAFAGKTIQIWDMARSPLKHQVDQPRTTKNFLPISSKNPKPIISEDLKRSSLASVVGSHTLTVRNTSTGAIEREFEFNRLGGLLVGWSHDLSMFAWVTKSGTTKIGKLFSGETKQVFTHLGGPIKRAVFSYDCQNVAFISGREASTSITIWNVVTGQKVLSFPSMYEKPKFVALSHDSRYLAAAYLLSKVKIWDLGKPIGTAPVKEILSKTLEWPGALAFSHDSRLLAVAQGIASFREDSSISIWDTSTMTLRQTIITDTVAESLSFSSDGSFLNTDRCCLVVRSNEPDCTHPGGGGIMMNPKRVGFYFSDDFSWIELHGKKMIYIPADYRRNLDHPKTISAIYRSDHPPANTTIAYSIQAEKDWLIELAETESSFV
jgi:WD40 repeat protein